MRNDNYQRQLKLCALRLLQNDCETLKQLALIRDPIFSLLSIQAHALFCCEAYAFLEVEFGKTGIEKEIIDMRNNLKRFSEKYGRITKQIEEADCWQDSEHSSKVKFDWIISQFLYDNMGIYLSEDHKIVGNTQFIADVCNLLYVDEEKRGPKGFDVAEEIGHTIGLLSTEISKCIGEKKIVINEGKTISHYADINTNRNKFFSTALSKEKNIFFLNIMGSVGYTKYELERRVGMSNPWMFRQKYISTYYAYRGLYRIKSHCEMNGGEIDGLREVIEDIVVRAEKIFNPKLRNCMMHYSLQPNENSCISVELFDECLPLFGLIKSTIGITYNEAYAELSIMANQIEDYISGIFNFAKLRVKNDL